MTTLTEAARMALEALEFGGLLKKKQAITALRTALAQSAEPMCMCKDRPASQCPGEWEPGCDLGNNPKYVRMYHPPAQRDERAALESIAEICNEEWHVRGNDSRLTEIRGIARAALEKS